MNGAHTHYISSERRTREHIAETKHETTEKIKKKKPNENQQS